MAFFIYLILTIVFFATAFIIVQTRLVYLNKYPEAYNQSYNGHAVFLDRFFAVVRVLIKKISSSLKLFYQKLLHEWVRLVAFLNNLSEKAYMKSRNKFMEEVVKDKKAVPHFWDHLKKYKREIDVENGNRIDDDSMNVIQK